MNMIDAVMVCMLVTLLVTTLAAWHAGSESRDVRLLAVLAGLSGAGAAAALAW